MENRWQVGRTTITFNGLEVPVQLLIMRFMRSLDRFALEGVDRIVFAPTDPDPQQNSGLTRTVSEGSAKTVYFFVDDIFVNWRKPFLNEFLSVFLLGFIITSALVSATPGLDRQAEKEERHYGYLMSAISRMFSLDPELWVLKLRLKTMTGVRSFIDRLYCFPAKVEKDIMAKELFILVMVMYSALRLLLHPGGLSLEPLVFPLVVSAIAFLLLQEHLGVTAGIFLILYATRHLYGDLFTVALYLIIILCGVWLIVTFWKKPEEKEPPLRI